MRRLWASREMATQSRYHSDQLAVSGRHRESLGMIALMVGGLKGSLSPWLQGECGFVPSSLEPGRTEQWTHLHPGWAGRWGELTIDESCSAADNIFSELLLDKKTPCF